jgi:adenylate cyclase
MPALSASRAATWLRQSFLPARAIPQPLPSAVIAAIGLAAGLAFATLPIFQRVEWTLYDLTMRASTRNPHPPSDLVVVAIDEPSFSEIGLQWPWPRRLHASLIDALVRGGARTIVLDLVFDVPSDPADDEALARAVRAAGNVVLASDRAATSDRAYSVQQWIEPLGPFAAGAAAVGAAGIEMDPDGVLRRTALTVDGRPTLALAAAMRQPGFILPGDPGSSRLIHFAGAPRLGILTVSYYQALEAGLLPSGIFRNKIVLVGRSLASAAALEAADHFRTPVSPRMAGVEVHANLAHTLLRHSAIADPFGAYLPFAVLCVAVGAVAGVIFFRVPPSAGLAALVAVTAAETALAYIALARDNLRLPIVGPLLAATGVYATSTAYRFSLGQRERRQIKRAFQHYVAPAIVQQMLDDPSRLALDGEEYDLTVMFTDLEGFTTVAERLTPEQLRSKLSTYFTAMMDRLLAEHATLDKFIGDAIMVYFGCPVRDAAHPLQGCRAALSIQRRLAELNASWGPEGFPELRMRIGINTGVAVAGNMGTDAIFNFTIIGDCVNLASRLEGVNKEYGTFTLVGADTWSHVHDQFEGRELDWIRVKGKIHPIAIYELAAEAGALPPARRAVFDRFAEGLALYRHAQWHEAAAAFRGALEIDPQDGPSRVFVARCAGYAVDPPQGDWDGVHVMHTK